MQRVDGNHNEIVHTLRRLGASVQSLASMGQGVPDLLVGFRGRNLLIEVKNGALPPSRRQLTEHEAVWHAGWRGQVTIVETVDDAVRLLTEAV